jgi:hypothetical protein
VGNCGLVSVRRKEVIETGEGVDWLNFIEVNNVNSLV